MSLSQSKLPSPQERMELILLGLGRKMSVKDLCRQAHVSRELFYRWMRRVRRAGLKELEPRLSGPKEVQVADPEAEILKLRAKLEALEKEKRRLRKENEHLELILKTARRTIRRRGWEEPEDPSKKNGE